MSLVLGIDPGKDGYFATLSTEGEMRTYPMPMINTGSGSKRVYDFPAIKELFKQFKADGVELIILEKQQAMRGQGVTSMFSTGQGYGLLEMACVFVEIPYKNVHPKTWKGVMCNDLPKMDPKKKSIIAAKRTFPTVDLKKTARCTTDHDGKADALLLAWYGLHKVLGAE